MSIKTTRIEWPSSRLEAVMALHRADSQRLGFFPRGAFEEHARARQILLAIDGRGEVVGYLLYRIAKQRAIIAHLCIAPGARKKGGARALVEHLKCISKPLAGIGLRCRQDYDARHLWAKLGFTALHRKAGRSHEGHELTFWWFDHGHPDLFSLVANNDDHRQKVVVDANVFYDLQGRERQDSEDSKALLADWVQANIELCVTKEIHNEIDRSDDADLRARSKVAVTRFSLLKSDDALFQQTSEELKPSFPRNATLRDESDLRQIAYAIAGEAVYFVTRDEKLSERCESLYERYGLRVLHPVELISHLDMIEREAKYRPARIAGSHLKSRMVKSKDVDLVIEAFRDRVKERANVFRKSVLHCLSKPLELESRLVTARDYTPVIFGVINRGRRNVLEITMLRTAEHPLAATMVRNFLHTMLEIATREKRTLVNITESRGGEVVDDAVAEFGFVRTTHGRVKITARVVGDFSTLRYAVTGAIIPKADELETKAGLLAINAAEESKSAVSVAAIESQFWPAKIIVGSLPTFIVAIRAEWAQHFFDDELASQLLFGTRDELLLGIEGVYYCSAKHHHLTAPARILWYVSKGNNGEGSMSIKACSRLEEISLGKPKDLFKRFQRLGVYQWKDVFRAAKNDLNVEILSFRFSMTERFTKPYPLNQLEALGIRGPFLSPRRISDSNFATIYSYGCALK